MGWRRCLQTGLREANADIQFEIALAGRISPLSSAHPLAFESPMSTRRRFVALCALPALVWGCTTRSPAGDVGPVLPPAAWGGTSSGLPGKAQDITHITVHHQGEIWQPSGNVAAYLVRLQQWSRTAKGWTDIPYHYVVAPDGLVYAARPWSVAGDTNTEYDPRGHVLVMLMGNFEVQHPTPEQWRATVSLIAKLRQKFQLALDRIGSHRDFSTQTLCPGAHLMARFPELRAAVAAQAL